MVVEVFGLVTLCERNLLPRRLFADFLKPDVTAVVQQPVEAQARGLVADRAKLATSIRHLFCLHVDPESAYVVGAEPRQRSEFHPKENA